jgi:peroxiredoxin
VTENPETESAKASTPAARSNAAIVLGWIQKALPWVLLSLAVWLVLDDVLTTESLVDEGSPAPALAASMADGSRFELAEHRGEVIILSFWATWCPPCRAEAPALTRIHHRLARRGGMVLGISNDREPLADILPRARGLGIEYPIAHADPETWTRYRITQLPTTYVISREGAIVWSHVGAVNEQRLGEIVRDL